MSRTLLEGPRPGPRPRRVRRRLATSRDSRGMRVDMADEVAYVQVRGLPTGPRFAGEVMGVTEPRLEARPDRSEAGARQVGTVPRVDDTSTTTGGKEADGNHRRARRRHVNGRGGWRGRRSDTVSSSANLKVFSLRWITWISGPRIPSPPSSLFPSSPSWRVADAGIEILLHHLIAYPSWRVADNGIEILRLLFCLFDCLSAGRPLTTTS